MTVLLEGFSLEAPTSGMIHSTGQRVVFTIQREEGNRRFPVLRFFSKVTPPPHDANDLLYFSVRGAIQRIRFFWRPDGTILGWSGQLEIPKEHED